MARSYGDILRAVELKKEYDKYIAYKEKSRAEKQALFRANGLGQDRFTYDETQVVWIAPFNQPAKSLYVQLEQVTTAAGTPATVALDLAGSYFTGTNPGNTATILDTTIFRKTKLAKLVAKRRKSTATTDSQSRITERYYKRHSTDSVSVFLGKNNATDAFDDAVRTIRALSGFENFVKTKGNTIQFVPEG